MILNFHYRQTLVTAQVNTICLHLATLSESVVDIIINLLLTQQTSAKARKLIYSIASLHLQFSGCHAQVDSTRNIISIILTKLLG